MIVDALKGDQTFFNDAAEVDAQWAFTDPLIAAKHGVTPTVYPRGSWGPKEADELMEGSRVVRALHRLLHYLETECPPNLPRIADTILSRKLSDSLVDRFLTSSDSLIIGTSIFSSSAVSAVHSLSPV